MNNDLHYDILDQERTGLLPLLVEFKDNFYLAGGTGLALQLGHRDSLDFDFFSKNEFDTVELFNEIETIFIKNKLKKVQEEKNTLSVLIDDKIKISFFAYPYISLNQPIDTQYFYLASIEDIGCMKLSALTSRSLQKDYVDLYFISQKIGLNNLLKRVGIKYPSIDLNLILKSMVYFGDIVEEPIVYKNNNDIEFSKIKTYFEQQLQNFLNK